jgi:hypothetical protein
MMTGRLIASCKHKSDYSELINPAVLAVVRSCEDLHYPGLHIVNIVPACIIQINESEGNIGKCAAAVIQGGCRKRQ